MKKIMASAAIPQAQKMKCSRSKDVAFRLVKLWVKKVKPSRLRYVSEWQKAKQSGKLPEIAGQEIRPEMTLKERSETHTFWSARRNTAVNFCAGHPCFDGSQSWEGTSGTSNNAAVFCVFFGGLQPCIVRMVPSTRSGARRSQTLLAEGGTLDWTGWFVRVKMWSTSLYQAVWHKIDMKLNHVNMKLNHVEPYCILMYTEHIVIWCYLSVLETIYSTSLKLHVTSPVFSFSRLGRLCRSQQVLGHPVRSNPGLRHHGRRPRGRRTSELMAEKALVTTTWLMSHLHVEVASSLALSI